MCQFQKFKRMRLLVNGKPLDLTYKLRICGTTYSSLCMKFTGQTQDLTNLILIYRYHSTFQFSWHLLFSQNHQMSVFEDILGSKSEAQKYINSKMFMSRGHLAPDGDFMLAAWQWATYYYANVNPQFQSINGGNWLKFERAVRELAQNVSLRSFLL